MKRKQRDSSNNLIYSWSCQSINFNYMLVMSLVKNIYYIIPFVIMKAFLIMEGGTKLIE